MMKTYINKFLLCDSRIYIFLCLGDLYSFFLQIGAVLKKLFDNGFVKREDLFITSKLWYAFYMDVLVLVLYSYVYVQLHSDLCCGESRTEATLLMLCIEYSISLSVKVICLIC